MRLISLLAGFDVFMELLIAFIALAISFYAIKCFKLTAEKPFLYLDVSFTLLAIGFLSDSLVTLYVRHFLADIVKFRFLLVVGNWILFITEILAYGLLAYLYFKQTYLMAAAFIPYVLREHNPLAEVIVIVLLMYVVIQSIKSYSFNKSYEALLVSAGFSLILASHVLFLLAIQWGLSYILAHFTQLVGFLCLLTMLAKVIKRR